MAVLQIWSCLLYIIHLFVCRPTKDNVTSRPKEWIAVTLVMIMYVCCYRFILATYISKSNTYLTHLFSTLRDQAVEKARQELDRRYGSGAIEAAKNFIDTLT